MAVCPNWKYAQNLEIAAISAFKPEYNITKGGDGSVGYRHTEEHKARISSWTKGKKYWLGRKHSPETIEKMRLARSKYWASKSCVHTKEQSHYPPDTNSQG